MIKASALLAAAAIGLLVAGVLASSLMMVYVSIGVCAAAALILAAGILAHWSEIFGRGESPAASVPESWSGPQVLAGTPVLASTQATGTLGREDQRPRREDAGGPPPAPPAEMVRPQAEFPVAGRSDDLWERVEEELGSGGKRDTGALSWPGIELPAPAESPGSPGKILPSEPEKGGPRDAPPVGAKAWIWGSGAGWQPPGTPDAAAWPPPAAAFAGAPARPEPDTPDADSAGADSPRAGIPNADTPSADSAGTDSADLKGAGPTDQEPASPDLASTASGSAGRGAEQAAGPVPEAAPAEPALDTDEASPGSPEAGAMPASPDGEAAGSAPDDEAGQPDAVRDRPQWIITLPGRESPAADPPSEAAETETGDPAAAAEDSATGEPAAGEPAAGEPAAGEPSVAEPDAQEPPAEKPEAGDPAASETGPGRVEVTVVPGVARYHRSGCILIRFLGAGDLEIMTRQEAEEAKFVPCRACQPDQLGG